MRPTLLKFLLWKFVLLRKTAVLDTYYEHIDYSYIKQSCFVHRSISFAMAFLIAVKGAMAFLLTR